MALISSGSPINYITIRSDYEGSPTTTFATDWISKFNGDFICWAPHLSVQGSATGNLIWGNGTERIIVYRCTSYNEKTNVASWSQIDDFTTSQTGSGTSYSGWKEYTATSYCLWKVTSSWSGSNTDYNWGSIYIMGYPIGYESESTYNSYYKGYPIRCCPNACFKIGTDYSSESACLRAINVAQYKGSYINVASKRRLCRFG